MNLELTFEEKDLLSELIDRRLTGLRLEIHRTDSPTYREGLDKELEILTALRERIPVMAIN